MGKGDKRARGSKGMSNRPLIPRVREAIEAGALDLSSVLSYLFKKFPEYKRKPKKFEEQVREAYNTAIATEGQEESQAKRRKTDHRYGGCLLGFLPSTSLQSSLPLAALALQTALMTTATKTCQTAARGRARA